MRCFLFLVSLFFIVSTNAQKGGVFIKCLNELDGKPVSICMNVKEDRTIIRNQCSNELGVIRFENLPIGSNQFDLLFEGNHFDTQNIFIQPNQVYQLVLEVNVDYLIAHTSKGTSYQRSANGESEALPSHTSSSVSQNNQMNAIYSDGSMNFESVNVTSYKLPLINYSGGSATTLTREDITRLPSRNVSSIVGTIGGVQSSEDGNTINIRGSRSGATVYYVDGIRMRNEMAIPKAYIEEVKVYTGGIPANYGDATGGVISIQTHGIDGYSEMNGLKSKRRRNKKRTTPSTYVYQEPDYYNSFDLDKFLPIYENDFLSSVVHPNSTFSIDVDRASWSYVKQRYKIGSRINRDAVKMEEMINAFSYKQVEVPQNELMHVDVQYSDCPWNDTTELVAIHLKATDMPENVERKPHNFVFLIDVSGSMQSEDKLGLLKQGLTEFVQTLNAKDRVSIVTYAGSSGVVLKPTLCKDKSAILNALDELEAGGSTNGIGGIQTAYELAEGNYNPELNNRIILCTDGDFNVGISSNGDLENYISKKRGKGIYLTALGFGMGNYKNDILETLADKGDGNHFYINDMAESKRVLVLEIGNLMNIARDVKLNVEFNPKEVLNYRLIGYENRLLKPKDFEDDTKDAGEIGYGHKVTAIYEITRGKSSKEKTHFTTTKVRGGEDLVFVKLRYKSFEDSSSVERKYALKKSHEKTKNELLNIVASFGLILRDSMFKGNMTPAKLKEMAAAYEAKNEDEKQLKDMILQL
ncbi:MAG: von Willebrand factor type A domain-containing protein [Crocinitomicaceae bacterium]|nr:von Willebrand factor type A domain-containing protein [Crocinitomicaceae bacterium]